MDNLELYKEVIQNLGDAELEDETVYYVLEMLADKLFKEEVDYNWDVYDSLYTRLNETWRYKALDDMSQEQSFLYGSVWGALRVLSIYRDKRSQEISNRKLVKKYKDYIRYLFLDYIYKEPGIQNKKLAKACHVSYARISQIASEAIKDGMIKAYAFGREKSYYIREAGEIVRDYVELQLNFDNTYLSTQLAHMIREGNIMAVPTASLEVIDVGKNSYYMPSDELKSEISNTFSYKMNTIMKEGYKSECNQGIKMPLNNQYVIAYSE